MAALPPLEKQDIQEHGPSMIATSWPLRDLIPNRTGGSTGTPLSFFLSHDRKCSRAAATIRHNRWAGWDVGDKVAILWGAARDQPGSGLRSRLRNLLLERQLVLDTGHITEAKLKRFHEDLKGFRPRVILAYAQAIALLARYVKSHGLSAYQPHAIVTSAEVLDDDARRLVEDVFGCQVFNRYGSREVSVIASECEAHRGMHVMGEGLYVEIEKNGSPAKPGEMGSILVTDLLNLAMPLIRYRIGDVASWEGGPCRCGRGLPRLAKVAGRVTDFLVGTDGRLVSGAFLSLYLVGQRPALGQVQLVQEEAGQVLFRIRRGPRFRASEELKYLCDTTRQYLGADTVVDWEYVDELPAEPSGKFLFCRSRAAAEYVNGWGQAASV
ncbi:MAG: hypothetical protein K2R98_33820 [Gemmataceae bacterium]|nr:hypothetical protein [Gemmataceae bacterium]